MQLFEINLYSYNRGNLIYLLYEKKVFCNVGFLYVHMHRNVRPFGML